MDNEAVHTYVLFQESFCGHFWDIFGAIFLNLLNCHPALEGRHSGGRHGGGGGVLLGLERAAEADEGGQARGASRRWGRGRRRGRRRRGRVLRKEGNLEREGLGGTILYFKLQFVAKTDGFHNALSNDVLGKNASAC